MKNNINKDLYLKCETFYFYNLKINKLTIYNI